MGPGRLSGSRLGQMFGSVVWGKELSRGECMDLSCGHGLGFELPKESRNPGRGHSNTVVTEKVTGCGPNTDGTHLSRSRLGQMFEGGRGRECGAGVGSSCRRVVGALVHFHLLLENTEYPSEVDPTSGGSTGRFSGGGRGC
jgi:hypothetical protein